VKLLYSGESRCRRDRQSDSAEGMREIDRKQDFYSEINQINPDADLRETTFFLDFADLRNQLLAGIHEP
jgi:hypothetical protein